MEGSGFDMYAVAGEAHWHVLLRARAIETQAYVLAAAQARQHNYSSPDPECTGLVCLDDW